MKVLIRNPNGKVYVLFARVLVSLSKLQEIIDYWVKKGFEIIIC